MSRLPDEYFDDVYAAARDPWRLAERWYEQRKYAITMAMLPDPRYRHAFEPGCSVGVLTEKLADRCDHVTSCDVAAVALDATRDRLGDRTNVTLRRMSVDEHWPAADVDLVVLSEVAYYLQSATLRRVLDRECARLAPGATVVAAHWRYAVDDYPLSGDEANALIAATADLTGLARYVDDDVVIDVLVKGPTRSVAVRGDVPGSAARL
jgi:predicted TPR repeat methyltransferase